MTLRYLSTSSQATKRFASRFASGPQERLVFHLIGELGAGKTTFVQGLFAACGVKEEISSPSFALASRYSAHGKRLLHLDFYRCTSPVEWLAAALDEDLDQASLAAIEWPEKADLLPPSDFEVRIDDAGQGDAREVTVSAGSAAGRRALSRLGAS